MATTWQAAPAATTNSANQNQSQPIIGAAKVPLVLVPHFQAAPLTTAVFQPRAAAAAIG